jgi:pyruvate/2-oxoglutarate dehydrogenase complex dihydrolipoamide dehydrogenase (E3) component
VIFTNPQIATVGLSEAEAECFLQQAAIQL